MKNKRIIICGSGASIRDGQWSIPIKDLPIWEAIKNECTIGLNFNYRFTKFTLLTFLDYYFYFSKKEELDQLPLIVGKWDPHIGTKKTKKEFFCEKGKNLYLLPRNRVELVNGKKVKYWGIDSWKKGFYDGGLVGIFALTLAIALGFKEIFLCGFDACSIDDRTHFYQGDKERTGYMKKKGIEITGIGFKNNKRTGKKIGYNTSIYDNNINPRFLPFKKELDKIDIYNVSPKSAITVFPKIDYNEFFQILKDNPGNVLQAKIRDEIEQLLLTRTEND